MCISFNVYFFDMELFNSRGTQKVYGRKRDFFIGDTAVRKEPKKHTRMVNSYLGICDMNENRHKLEV